MARRHGVRCLAKPCPTDVQNGRVGMLAHLQVVHHPDLAFDRLAEMYDLADPP